jgi:formylglycine-generating enzyme required for sulfatase activity
VDGTLTFPAVGMDLSGSGIRLREDGFEATVKGVTYSQGTKPVWLEVSVPECSWWLTPRITTGIEIDRDGLKSFEAIAQGDVAIAQAVTAQIVLIGVSAEKTLFDLAGPCTLVYLGQLGPIPVFATLGVKVGLTAKAEAKAIQDYSAHYRQDHSVAFGLTYERTDGLDWVHTFQSGAADMGGAAELTGEFKFHLTLDPRLEFLVYGLAGVKAAVKGSAGVLTAGSLGGGQWDGKVEADADFVLGTAGKAFEKLGFSRELSLNIWHGEWPLTPQTLKFTTHPRSQTVAPGAAVSFSCVVESSAPPALQWYHKGTPIPGQRNRTLFLPRVNNGHAGAYFVRAQLRELVVDSETAILTVQTTTPANLDSDGDGVPDIYETGTGVWVSPTDRGTDPYRWDSDGDGLSDGVEDNTGVFVSRNHTGTNPNLADTDGDGVSDKREIDLGTDPNSAPAPAGMVLIPGGSNSGSNPLGSGESYDPNWYPQTYSLTVSSFYMDRYEVTKALWDEVKNWNGGNGYSYDNAGSGKAPDHPVQTVNWYDCVKWCNARSRKEGRTPAYYTDAACTQIYKTGRVLEPYVKASANGYRLPTDAQWEYAARGGGAGKRFPWGGNTISHTQANYGANNWSDYDLSSGGYHPTYATGGRPYTSPVGAFEAGKNAYGLYDMAGNVWEWCYDWYPGYVGSRRVIRGGSWPNIAGYCRVGNRGRDAPGDAYNTVGFRAVLLPGQ